MDFAGQRAEGVPGLFGGAPDDVLDDRVVIAQRIDGSAGRNLVLGLTHACKGRHPRQREIDVVRVVGQRRRQEGVRPEIELSPVNVPLRLPAERMV